MLGEKDTNREKCNDRNEKKPDRFAVISLCKYSGCKIKSKEQNANKLYYGNFRSGLIRFENR